MPLSDKKEDGTFRNLQDNSIASFLPWEINQPDRGVSQSGVMLKPSGYVKDSSEEFEDCFACSIPKAFTLLLRGLCVNSFFSLLTTILVASR